MSENRGPFCVPFRVQGGAPPIQSAGDKNCKDCRFFHPSYYHVGLCKRTDTFGSKLFCDDSKASIMVDITFGCVQFEAVPDVKEELL